MNKFITRLLLVAFATPATFAASEHAFAQEDQLEQPMKKRSKKKRSKKKRSKKRKSLQQQLNIVIQSLSTCKHLLHL